MRRGTSRAPRNRRVSLAAAGLELPGGCTLGDDPVSARSSPDFDTARQMLAASFRLVHASSPFGRGPLHFADARVLSAEKEAAGALEAWSARGAGWWARLSEILAGHRRVVRRVGEDGANSTPPPKGRQTRQVVACRSRLRSVPPPTKTPLSRRAHASRDRGNNPLRDAWQHLHGDEPCSPWLESKRHRVHDEASVAVCKQRAIGTLARAIRPFSTLHPRS